MASGTDVVNAFIAMLRIQGIHYDQCWTRCWPNLYPHCTDCSGASTYDLIQVGIPHQCDGSFAQSRTIHAAGGGMSVEEAFKTPGAFLFQGMNEGQGGIPGVDPGHVGISAGDDQHTLEARGHVAGVGWFLARSLVWDYAGMFPGVTKAGQQPPYVPPPVLAVEEDDDEMIALKSTAGTPQGRAATARVVKAFNFVLLEDGGRLHGDVQIDQHRHWWAPPNLHHDIPGAQIVSIADLRPLDGEQAIAVRYSYPNGDSGTYKAQMV